MPDEDGGASPHPATVSPTSMPASDPLSQRPRSATSTGRKPPTTYAPPVNPRTRRSVQQSRSRATDIHAGSPSNNHAALFLRRGVTGPTSGSRRPLVEARGSSGPLNKKDLSEADICAKFITPAIRRSGLGRAHPDPAGGPLHQGPDPRPRQDGRPGQVEVRRLHPLLQAEHPDRDRRGEGQQPRRRRRDAAGARSTPRSSTSRSSSPRTAMASSSTTAPAPCRRWNPRSRSSASLARTAVVDLPRLEGPHRRAGARSSSRTTSTTAADGSPATTSATRSTRRPRRSPRGRTAYCSSWRPAPARPTPRSRSSGGSGRPGRKKRVLYLADRNVLIDQTMVNDFRPFKGAMAKLSTALEDHRERRTARPGGSRPRSTESGASTRRTRSTSASTRRSLAPRSGRRSSASSRPTSST